jgi:hypothetical protein
VSVEVYYLTVCDFFKHGKHVFFIFSLVLLLLSLKSKYLTPKVYLANQGIYSIILKRLSMRNGQQPSGKVAIERISGISLGWSLPY